MKNIIKLIITIIIFIILFRYVNIQEVSKIILGANLFYIFLALISQILSTFIASYRWYLIMSFFDFKENLTFYIKSYFKSTFFNQVLPGSIGGDAVRVFELGSMGYSKKEAFSGILVDRVVGVFGLIILNFVSNIANKGTFPGWLFDLINLISIIGIIGFFGLIYLRNITRLKDIKFLSLFYRLSNKFHLVYNRFKTLALHSSITIIIHLFTIFAMFFLSKAVNLNLDFGTLLVAIPPIFLLTIIPLSLAGWGVRESAMVGILVLAGADREAVLSVSIMYGLILIASSLPGAYYWMRSKKGF